MKDILLFLLALAVLLFIYWLDCQGMTPSEVRLHP